MNVLIDLLFAYVRASSAVLLTILFVLSLILLCNFLRVRKRVSYLLLWIVVIRMLLPIGLTSEYSLFNLPLLREYSQRYDIPDHGGYVGDYEVAVQGTDTFDEALYSGLEPIKDEEMHFQYLYYVEDTQGEMRPPETFREKYGALVVCIWLGGVILFWGYGILSALLLRRRVSTATIVEPGVYETDRINAPFILGIFRPTIYLPLGLDENQRELILCHERMHLRWGDHIFKMIAYFAVGLHWANIWTGFYFYRAFLSIMEEACDQDVLLALGRDRKADYSEALLRFSTKRQFGRAMTVAFSENWIEERIKTVLKYKKPFRWLTIPAVLLVLAATVSLSTNSVNHHGSVIRTQTLTHEEMLQTDLPGSVIRFYLTAAENVHSLSFDLELWDHNGLVQQQRILDFLPAYGQSFSEELLIEWAFDLESEPALYRYHSMGWTLHIGDDLAQGSLALPETRQAMFTGLLGHGTERYALTVKDNAVLFCGLFNDNKAQIDCNGLSDRETVPVEEGQFAAVLRMKPHYSTVPTQINIHDLLPRTFLPTDSLEISAEGKNLVLSGEAARNLLLKLGDLSFRYQMNFGLVGVSHTGQPTLLLHAKDGQTRELLLEGETLTLIDPDTGMVRQARGGSFESYILASEIYRLLDIPKTSREVFQIDPTSDETIQGWRLYAGIPSKDTWLYTDADLNHSMLLMQGSCYPMAFGYQFIPKTLQCTDLDQNGTEELLIYTEKDGVTEVHVLSPAGEDWDRQVLSDDTLFYHLEPSYGTYADDPSCFSLHLNTRDYAGNWSHWFDRQTLPAQYTDWEYAKEDPLFYRNAVFSLTDGRLTARFTCYLRLEKEDQTVSVSIADVTASIRYLDRKDNGDRFQIYDVAIEPLDNR